MSVRSERSARTELGAALQETAHRNGVGAVIIFGSPVVFDQRTRITVLGREKRVPTVSLFTEFAEAGGPSWVFHCLALAA